MALLARKLDLAYTIWFALHLVIMFCVDLVPFYPAAVQPSALLNLRRWYIETYHDRFFVAAPAWFTSYAVMELLYHVPLSIWAIKALIEDDPMVPVHLLVWSVQTAVTTATCIVEYMAWDGVTQQEVWGLHGLYGPYLGLALFMGGDMFGRLQDKLSRKDVKKLD